jgi:cell shape-determining protein MreC
MKLIVFILVVIVLLAILVCCIALTKYLNFDRKIKEAKLKELEMENKALRKESDALYKYIKDKKHDKNSNRPENN